MAQTYYRPRFKKQLTGSTLGPSNCNMAAAAMLADRDTLGLVNVTADAMRKASGDTSGGTSQDGAVTALSKYGIAVTSWDGNDGKDWADFVAFVRSGVCASAAIDYSFVPYALRGDKDFVGTHQVFVNEYRVSDGAFLVYDGLADGRRAGIPTAPDWWPGSVLRASMQGMVGPDLWYLAPRKRTAVAKTAVVNIRSGPGTTFAVIEQFKLGASRVRGSRAKIGGAVGANRVWWPVWLPGKARVGYVHSSVITLK